MEIRSESLPEVPLNVTNMRPSTNLIQRVPEPERLAQLSGLMNQPALWVTPAARKPSASNCRNRVS